MPSNDMHAMLRTKQIDMYMGQMWYLIEYEWRTAIIVAYGLMELTRTTINVHTRTRLVRSLSVQIRAKH